MEYIYSRKSFIDLKFIIKCGKYTIGKVSVTLYYVLRIDAHLCLAFGIIFFTFVVASSKFVTLYFCKYYQSYHQHNVIWVK